MRPAKEVHYTKRMNLDQVLTFTFSNLFKQAGAYGHWMLLGLIIALINLIPVGILLMGIDFSGSMPFYLAPEEALNNVSTAAILAAAVFFILAMLVDLFFAFYSTAWFYRVGLDGYDNIKRSFGERIRIGFADLGPVAAVTLLIGIINLVFMLPYLVVTIVSDTGSGTEMEGLANLLNFGYTIAAYFFAVKFSCVYGLIMDKKMGIIEALKTSWEMTKGRGWRIFGHMFLIALLAIILVLVLLIPVMIIWFIAVMTSFTPAVLSIAVIISIIAYILIICIFYGISANRPIAVYKRLTIEHEEDLPKEVETTDPNAGDDIQF